MDLASGRPSSHDNVVVDKMTAFLSLAHTQRPSTSVVRHFLVPFRCNSRPLSPSSSQFLHSKSSFQPHTQSPHHRRPTSTRAATGHHTRLKTKATAQTHYKNDVDNTNIIPTTTTTNTITSPLTTKQHHPSVRTHLANGLGVVTLKSNKARLFLARRATTVYSGAIQTTYGTLHMNSHVVVLDSSMRVIGYGLYNPTSLFRVRLLRIVHKDVHINNKDDIITTTEEEQWRPSDDLKRLVRDAVQMRRLFGLPSEHTDVYRVVNADGDGMPGLFVDRFANFAIVSSCAAWCEALRNDIEMIVANELKPDGVTQIIWRPHIDRLKQDGYTLPDNTSFPTTEKKQHQQQQATGNQDRDDDVVVVVHDGAAEDVVDNGGGGENEDKSNNSVSTTADFDTTDTDIDAQVRINAIIGIEQGVRYAIPHWVLNTGQKTGHYADQRDTRIYVATLIKQMTHHHQSSSQNPIRLLDLFCYSGGFSLNALLASTHVHATAIDSSKHALAMLRHNADLNNVAHRLLTIRGDASKPVVNGCTYDVVIVDPPKLAPNVKALQRALGKYRRINEQALKAVRKEGGVIVSCSCSSAIAQNRGVFVDMVRDAAAAVGRSVALVKTFGAAPDHVVHAGMLETEYLTVCVFSVR